ncbi:MAG: flagellar basal body L-ring protein FlgH [Phycisphaerae bacterium]|nr:flagellar basal body L-ring protein FlgH [Phycisphaerae bacterium]
MPTADATGAPSTQPSNAYGQVLGMNGGADPAVAVGAIPTPMPAGAGKPLGQAAAAAAARDATMTPAVVALQRSSFTAIAPPEPRTYVVHDLVTIIVREETSFSTDGKTELDKKADLDAKLDSWMKFQWKNPPLKSIATTGSNGASATPELKTEAERKFTGDAKVNRKDTFIGRLTAEVLDVKPNGTLVLAAKKYIQTDEEKQYFELSGTCRLTDVGADNTVLSTQLADLTVTKTHTGAARDTTKRGILPWLTDKIGPW